MTLQSAIDLMNQSLIGAGAVEAAPGSFRAARQALIFDAAKHALSGAKSYSGDIPRLGGPVQLAISDATELVDVLWPDVATVLKKLGP